MLQDISFHQHLLLYLRNKSNQSFLPKRTFSYRNNIIPVFVLMCIFNWLEMKMAITEQYDSLLKVATGSSVRLCVTWHYHAKRGGQLRTCLMNVVPRQIPSSDRNMKYRYGRVKVRLCSQIRPQNTVIILVCTFVTFYFYAPILFNFL